jgi:CubicO group peptidase (beta-lactamase class C family)
LSMQGVARYYRPGEVDARALLAGNDVLLFSQDVPRAVNTIRDGLRAGNISEAELDYHVFKILLAKEALGLHKQRLVPIEAGLQVLQQPEARILRRELYRAAITLVKNDRQALPIHQLAQQKVACVQVGYDRNTPLFEHLRLYTRVDEFRIGQSPAESDINTILQQLREGGYTHVIVAIYKLGKYPPRYGLQSGTENLVEKLAGLSCKRTVVLFGSPYAADFIKGEDALVVAYEEAVEAQQAVAEVIFGAYIPSGKLPVRLRYKRQPSQVPYQMGARRFGFAEPEQMGLDENALARLDTVATNYIRVQAMPGCAVYVLRGNYLVWHKAYGYTTFDSTIAIDPYQTIYDIASITKVAATTMMAMKLYEEEKLDLQAPIGRYLPELRNDPKYSITIIQLLTHKAGFIAHWPFWRSTISEGRWKPGIFQPNPSVNYSINIGPGMWMHRDYPDTMLQRVLRLPSDPDPRFVYSDISMIILAKILERIAGQTIDQWLKSQVYDPMGMNQTLFNPKSIVTQACTTPPTAEDTHFRFGRIEGYVNDDNAALLGGVAGHAGLFCNGYDLIKLGLMLKNCGAYGDTSFLQPETINRFTTQAANDSRRGLGWDRAEIRRGYVQPTSQWASAHTYGHLGFTGTAFWIDPENDLVFVLLTNRTWPNADEKKQYVNEGVRIQMMDCVYNAIRQYQQKQLQRIEQEG